MRKYFLSAMLMCSFAQLLLAAQTAIVTIPGTAGPWSQALNPSFNYGVGDNTAPVVIDASNRIPFTTGAVITVEYLGGLVSASASDPAYLFVDAKGDLNHPATPGGTSNGTFPTSFGSSPSSGYLAQLVGTFTNGGIIVGTPFIVGDGPLTLIIPAGATQLQLGINDNFYRDNAGSFEVSSTLAPTAVPEPNYFIPITVALLSIPVVRSRRKSKLNH